MLYKYIIDRDYDFNSIGIYCKNIKINPVFSLLNSDKKDIIKMPLCIIKTNIKKFYCYEMGNYFGIKVIKGDILFSTHEIIFGVKHKGKLIKSIKFRYELI